MAKKQRVKSPTASELEGKSPFIEQTTSFYLPLSPCAYDFPLEGLCAEHISPLLLTYYPPLRGVVISYSNPRISEYPPEENGGEAPSHGASDQVLSRSIDEYAVSFIWLTADFLLFRPSKGTYLEGYVNLQNESILGLICYNYFNAGIESDKLSKDWSWDGESYVDGQGKQITGKVIFRVEDFNADGGESIQITGTLLEEG